MNEKRKKMVQIPEERFINVREEIVTLAQK